MKQLTILLMFIGMINVRIVYAQDDTTNHLKVDNYKLDENSPEDDLDLDDLLTDENAHKTEIVRNAFKSTRIINGQSIEMLGEGTLDFRILHRFGLLNGGIKNFFGLDQASMRMGFDYSISDNLAVGIGRSTYKKEIDGYIKYKFANQRKGEKPFPVSMVGVAGMTVYTIPFPSSTVQYYFSHRLGYFFQSLIGRKFSDAFSFQISPTFVHRNLVEKNTDKNDMFSLGLGGRLKISNRTALILDTYPILYGARKDYNYFPISLGLDIETGGHVFQLHVSNARGMNENAFITETYQQWQKGEVQFGFNLSRVFTVKKNRSTSF